MPRPTLRLMGWPAGISILTTGSVLTEAPLLFTAGAGPSSMSSSEDLVVDEDGKGGASSMSIASRLVVLGPPPPSVDWNKPKERMIIRACGFHHPITSGCEANGVPRVPF